MKKKSLFKADRYIYKFSGFVVCLSLLIPFFVFLLHVKRLSLPEGVEWLSVFGWTFFQAFLTGLISLFFGLLGSRGILYFNAKYRSLIKACCLIPAFIPSLLFCVSLVNLTEQFLPFPFGLPALIFIQSLVSIGFSACIFSDTLEKEALELSEWSLVHGISSWKFLYTCAKTILKRDIKITGVFIFVNAFTSLSVPLLVAGSPHISLEFFIYENLKNPTLWPEALSLILIQMLFVFAVCIWGFAFKREVFQRYIGEKRVCLIPIKWFVLIPLFPPMLYLTGLFFSFSYEEMKRLLQLGYFLLSAVWSSFVLGIGVGALTILALCLMALSFQSISCRKFVLAYLNPGTTLTGFAFLIMAWPLGVWFDWTLGLSLLLFPLIYRFYGESLLEKLEGQVETAKLFGAGWGLIFRDVIWPGCYKGFFLCGGIAGFWASGEFAYTLIVSKGEWNLALMVYDLFSSYRLERALQAAWLLLITSGLVLLFWSEVAVFIVRQFTSHASFKIFMFSKSDSMCSIKNKGNKRKYTHPV